MLQMLARPIFGWQDFKKKGILYFLFVMSNAANAGKTYFSSIYGNNYLGLYFWRADSHYTDRFM